MLQQLHAEKGVAEGLRAAEVRLLGLRTRLMRSSVIQGSTANSSNNPGMLYWTPLTLGTRLKHTEQYCMSNSITTHLGSSTIMPCMHTSQRVKEYYKNTHGNWQLSLRVEKKPLSSHDRQKLASGLSGGIDATWELIDIHVYAVYSAVVDRGFPEGGSNNTVARKARAKFLKPRPLWGKPRPFWSFLRETINPTSSIDLFWTSFLLRWAIAVVFLVL